MKTNHPDKQVVRDYLQRRREPVSNAKTPPPTPEQIRRELGWDMIRDEETPKTPGT